MAEELEIEVELDESDDGKSKSKVRPIHIIDAYYIVLKERSIDVYVKKDDKFSSPWHYIEPESAFKAIHRDMLKKAMHNHAASQRADTILGLIHMLNSFNEKFLPEVMAAFESEELKKEIASRNVYRLEVELEKQRLISGKEKPAPKKTKQKVEMSDEEFIGIKEEPEEPEDSESE